MLSEFPSFDEVRAGLGDKVIGAVSLSVADAKERLAVYRQTLPDHAAEHSQRGLANMINDWLWASIRRSLDPVASVALNDREPTHEIGVGLEYRLRVKRHRDGRVRSYPTQTFLDFQLQGQQLAFPSMSEVRLNVGYRWDEETRSISAPVISLPHGADVIWHETLESVAPNIKPLRPDADGPQLPVIEVVEDDDAEGTEDR
ncbi:hypothetical protein [Actinomycetospora flava]|uniref:Uncharacterized protein n=1 Tax=Actinomycetospora flava TaxID=3129232 RepID=A0ABU8MC41_9PSEU